MCGNNTVQDILSDYVQFVFLSGYTVKFRKKILMAGLNGYNKILEQIGWEKNPYTEPRAGEILPAGRNSRGKPKTGWGPNINPAFLSL